MDNWGVLDRGVMWSDFYKSCNVKCWCRIKPYSEEQNKVQEHRYTHLHVYTCLDTYAQITVTSQNNEAKYDLFNKLFLAKNS